MELRHIWVCTAGKKGTLLRTFWEFMDVLEWFVFHVYRLWPITTSFVKFFQLKPTDFINLYLQHKEVFRLCVSEEDGKFGGNWGGQWRHKGWVASPPPHSLGYSLHLTSYMTGKA